LGARDLFKSEEFGKHSGVQHAPAGFRDRCGGRVAEIAMAIKGALTDMFGVENTAAILDLFIPSGILSRML
jgi:hypothetical protein